MRFITLLAATLVLSVPASAKPAIPLPTCSVHFTQADHAHYARVVYKRHKISWAARRHLANLRLCQHTSAARANTRKLEHTLLKARHLQRRIDAMGVKGIAYQILLKRGAVDQFPCVDFVFTHESGWLVSNPNGASQADGIAQANPASKYGPGWQGNALIQITWGIDYMYSRYGSPCGAAAFWHAHSWY